MANEVVDGEFWLPSDFLTDDFAAGEDILNEAESDEDESVAGLTRQMMAHSFLHRGPPTYSSALKVEKPMPSEMATSPQSTLCGVGSRSFSSNVSPDEASPFPMPRGDPLDLLCAAARQVERLGLAPPQKHSRQAPGAINHGDTRGVLSSEDLRRRQLQAARFYQLKREQQRRPAWARNQNGVSSSARQLPGSGMAAVFLDGGRRQSNGTGVFLPRSDLKGNQQAAARSPELRLPQEWTY